MKKMLVALVAMPMMTYANLAELEILNLNISYNSPVGSGTVDKINYVLNEESLKKMMSVELEKEENTYHLKYGEESFAYQDQLGLLDDVEKGKIVDLDVRYVNDTLMANFQYFDGKKSDGYVSLENFSLNCPQKASFQESAAIDLLESCLHNGRISLEKINSQSSFDYTISDFANEMLEEIAPDQVHAMAPDIGNINASVSNGKLNFNVKAAGIKLKGYGTAKLNGRRNQITLKITKVKAGFLNVTGTFFEKIQGMASDKVIIRRPYIKIKLK